MIIFNATIICLFAIRISLSFSFKNTRSNNVLFYYQILVLIKMRQLVKSEK